MIRETITAEVIVMAAGIMMAGSITAVVIMNRSTITEGKQNAAER